MFNKSSILIVSIFMLLVGCGGSAEKKTVVSTKFPFETGRISYSINGSDQDRSTSFTGEKVLIFKDWGDVIVQKSTRQNTDITGAVFESTSFEKWDNGYFYGVNFDFKKIYRSELTEDTYTPFTYPDVTKKRSKSSNLQVMWVEEVINTTCLNYLLNDLDYATSTTWCVFKDKIILKEVVDISAIGHYETTIANDIQFDIELSDDLFELPDFPEEEFQY